jgi:hypothetical protein
VGSVLQASPGGAEACRRGPAGVTAGWSGRPWAGTHGVGPGSGVGAHRGSGEGREPAPFAPLPVYGGVRATKNLLPGVPTGWPCSPCNTPGKLRRAWRAVTAAPSRAGQRRTGGGAEYIPLLPMMLWPVTRYGERRLCHVTRHGWAGNGDDGAS